MITYVSEEMNDVDSIINNCYRDVFLAANKIKYKLSVAKELMGLLKQITMEPLVDSHIDMYKHINYTEYVNRLIVEVDSLILVTKQSRRFKKFNIEDVVNIAKIGVNNTDGCKHDEVKLFMYSFLIYELIAEVHSNILVMELSNEWKTIPETLNYIEHSSIMALKNVCDNIFKMIETKLCELLDITKYDSIIEETLGVKIDEIYMTMLDYMDKLS